MMSQAEEHEALVRLISDVMRASNRFVGKQVAQPISWDERTRIVLAEIAKAAQEWPTERMMKLHGSATWRSFVASSPLVKGQDE